MNHGKKKVFGVLLLIIGLLTSARAQETLDLNEFIQRALASNQLLQVVAESIRGAEAKVTENRSLYFPQVTLSASYTRLSLVSEFTLPFNGEMMTFKFVSPNNYSVKFGLAEQLFNWGRTQKLVRLSQIGAELAQDAVSMARQAISYQLVPVFYGLIFIQDAAKVLDDNLDQFAAKLAIAKQRFQAGLASDFDISLIQVQISALKAQQLEFQNTIERLMLAYNKVVGRDVRTPFAVDGRLEFQPLESNPDDLLREALANRIELKQLAEQEKLTRTQIALARTGDKPTLLALLNYEFRNGYLPNVDQIRGSWSAVLSASYPIFDGFRTKAQVTQAKVGLETVLKQRIELEQQITLEINQNLADLKTIASKLEIEKTKISHAENALKIAEQRHQNGMLSTTDLIDTQNALESARLNYLQLIYNHILGTYNLYKAVGRRIYQNNAIEVKS